jgi:hypothetical protein
MDQKYPGIAGVDTQLFMMQASSNFQRFPQYAVYVS